jgi:hypothetical protein
MKQRTISDKSRFLRALLVLIVMLAVGTIFDYVAHMSFRFWLTATFAPIAFAGCTVFLLLYLAMRLKQRALKLPEGL